MSFPIHRSFHSLLQLCAVPTTTGRVLLILLQLNQCVSHIRIKQCPFDKLVHRLPCCHARQACEQGGDQSRTLPGFDFLFFWFLLKTQYSMPCFFVCISAQAQHSPSIVYRIRAHKLKIAFSFVCTLCDRVFAPSTDKLVKTAMRKTVTCA